MSVVRDQLYATVAVDQPVDRTYVYSVPEEWRRGIGVGSRVMVPLGRGNRMTAATVLGLGGTPPVIGPAKGAVKDHGEELLFDAAGEAEVGGATGGRIKAIGNLLRDAAAVPGDLIELAKWISAYYCAPIGMTLATMVPAAVKRGTRLPANLIVHLVKTEAGWEEQVEGKKMGPRARKVFEAIHRFVGGEGKAEQEVLTEAKTTREMVKRLAGLGLLRVERRVQMPEPTGVRGENSEFRIQNSELVLSGDQITALAAIEGLIDAGRFGVRLIHGVTGSGKTELYIRAIEQVVAAGKRAIVLVPEISLTPQAVARFKARFDRVAVLHSGLNDTARHQHWHAIATGWAQVIVGARSAVFAPAADIGIIVVDEEHDSSYKQDSLPKYHGRDVAIRRGQMLNVPVLLGSATPSLESWHNADARGGEGNSKWGLLSLRTRPLGTQMPRVTTVDMKAEAKLRRGLHILSTALEHHLKQTLERKKQAIFLLNRRGYAHYVLCPRCDWVLMCENCDATMVVHRERTEEKGLRTEGVGSGNGSVSGNAQSSVLSPHRSLKGTVQCHYCLTANRLPQVCPACQARLTHLGQGTQRAEDELLRKFPYIRLKRMDSDSMHNMGAYQQTLDDFGAGKLDLLIGTQMISKGLDFPNVSLVGVLNADLAMAMPDFRAAERTFQLICQVAGRSGRAMGGGEQGRVIVQTFQPNEPAIVAACNHDYLGFVGSELPHRQEFGYPPYGRLARIVLSHKSFATVTAQGEELGRLIAALVVKLNLPVRVQGPIPPPMQRLNEQYRVELILFADSAGPLQRLLASLRARGALASGKVAVSVDVDPLNML